MTMEKAYLAWLTHVLGIVKGYISKTRSQYRLTLYWRETEKETELNLDKSHLDWTFSKPKVVLFVTTLLWHREMGVLNIATSP